MPFEWLNCPSSCELENQPYSSLYDQAVIYWAPTVEMVLTGCSGNGALLGWEVSPLRQCAKIWLHDSGITHVHELVSGKSCIWRHWGPDCNRNVRVRSRFQSICCHFSDSCSRKPDVVVLCCRIVMLHSHGCTVASLCKERNVVRASLTTR